MLPRPGYRGFTDPPLERLYTNRFWNVIAGWGSWDPEMTRLEMEVQLRAGA